MLLLHACSFSDFRDCQEFIILSMHVYCGPLRHQSMKGRKKVLLKNFLFKMLKLDEPEVSNNKINFK